MDRSLFLAPALEVAPQLLGALLTVCDGFDSEGLDSGSSAVTLRITEVEAYHGVGTLGPYDAGSHSRDRQTPRNASMFGPPGHAYVYLSYGVHFALNLVCSPAGSASGVLLRAGEIGDGARIARARREAGSQRAKRISHPIPDSALARGPGNLASALGITRPLHDGRDLFASPFALEAAPTSPNSIASGPRVGVSGEAGGAAFPWRFWIAGDPTVSAYRAGRNVPKP